MNKAVVITGAGRDRVGIVAELTQFLYESGGNLLDSSMTLLRGEFALILMVELPGALLLDSFEKSLQVKGQELGLMLTARELTVSELKEDDYEGSKFIISVYGADRCGIVAGITKILASLNLNITDVETKSIKQSANDLFVMILEVSTKASTSAASIKKSLSSSIAELDVEITVQELEIMEL